MRKIKTILFLTPRFYPQIGGVETHALSVSRELVNRGYRVIIISEALGKEMSSDWQSKYMSDSTIGLSVLLDKSIKIKEAKNRKTELSDEDLTIRKSSSDTEKVIVYRLPEVKKNRLKKFIIWQWLLKNIKIIQEADIVHCHDVFYWYLPFRFLYFRKPVFTTFHGYEKYPVPFKNIVIRKISEKLSWGNICVGIFIEKWYGTKATFITHGGVDSKIKNPKSIRQLRLNRSQLADKNTTKKLKILFIGRLDRDTGVLLYASALKLLREKNVKFEFEVCGDGSLKKNFEQYGKVHGFVGNVAKYLTNSDVVLTSSYLSILQALLFKKPVIAVYDNLLKEDYLKETPFSKWINIVNTEIDMFNKIDHIINNPNNRKLLDGYNWVKLQTWENLTDIYLNLWNKQKL